MRKASLTYDDYLKQMAMVKKMGSFKSILKMLPGMSQLGDLDFSEKEFGKLEAMILSMTPSERSEKDELTFSRRKRVALRGQHRQSRADPVPQPYGTTTARSPKLSERMSCSIAYSFNVMPGETVWVPGAQRCGQISLSATAHGLSEGGLRPRDHSRRRRSPTSLKSNWKPSARKSPWSFRTERCLIR